MTQNKAIRIDKVKNKRRAFGGIKALVQLALLVTVVVVTLTAATGIMDNISRTQEQIAILDEQIIAAEARRQEIEDAAAYVSSIDFVEYIARTRLNLVRRDEIIFIMTSE